MTRRQPSLLSIVESAALAALLVAPAPAQVVTNPVGQDSGPVSEITRGVREDSGPVYGDGGPVRGLSVEAGSDGSVRGSTTRAVRGGAVKDITVGSVRTRLPPGFYAPRQREEAAEMRIDDVEDADPLPAAEPVRDLRPLVETMRAIEPLPEHEPAAADEEVAQASEPLADEVEVPQVDNPDEVDPTKPEPPSAPDAEGPAGVFLPPPPKVGAPSEVVPIPMPGSTPEPDYD